jgi:hypothetical protein
MTDKEKREYSNMDLQDLKYNALARETERLRVRITITNWKIVIGSNSILRVYYKVTSTNETGIINIEL